MLQRKSRDETVGGRADLDLTMLESSGVVAAIVVSADGVVLAANARMRRFLGLGGGDLSVKQAKSFRAYLADTTAWAAWCDAARTGRTIELELRGFDDATKRLRGDVRVEGDGVDQRFVGILVDGDDGRALR